MSVCAFGPMAAPQSAAKPEALYWVFKRSVTSFRHFVTARKYTIANGVTIDEALAICQRFNKNRSPSQIRRGTKAEFTAQ